ncbi:hypothetical protein OG912_36900 [Streptomyces sp. NBC_00464]
MKTAPGFNQKSSPYGSMKTGGTDGRRADRPRTRVDAAAVGSVDLAA